MGQDLPFDSPGSPLQRERIVAPAAHAPRLALAARDWREYESPAGLAAWDSLAISAVEPNPFFESWYLLPALRAFDPRATVRLVVLEADGQLVGLLPVRREAFYYGYPLPHLRSWTHANCFLGAPLVARGFEHAFWSHLLAWADSHTGLSLFLHLAHLPASGPLHQALADVIGAQDRSAATVLREERALLSSTATPEAYYEAALSAKKRKELRRQHRRLEEEGNLSVERLENGEGLAAWTSQFLALEMRGWKGRAGSALASDQRTAALFTDALRGAAQRGRLQRLTLALDGKPIAMLASFLTPPGAFSFKTAFDEDYARFSPGVLLQRENLDILDRPDIVWTDSCAAQDHPMIDHIWRERRAIVRHSIAIGGALRRTIFAALARRETGHPAKGIQ